MVPKVVRGAEEDRCRAEQQQMREQEFREQMNESNPEFRETLQKADQQEMAQKAERDAHHRMREEYEERLAKAHEQIEMLTKKVESL